MNKTEIKLSYPITVDGQPISTLHMRRATVGDRLRAQKACSDDADREIRLMADLCEVPTSAIESVDLADYAQLQRVFLGFTVTAPSKT